MGPLNRLCLLVVAALATLSPAADASWPLDVTSVAIRFRAPSAADDSLAVRLSFATSVVAAFDPATDDVEIGLGTADAFRVGPDVASNVRVRGHVVSYRRPRGAAVGARSPFRLLVVDLGRGRVTAQVDRAGAFATRTESEWTVPISLRIGAAAFSTIIDFTVSRGGGVWSAPAPRARRVRLVRETLFGLPSSIDEPRTVVVRDADAWTALWAEHVKNISPPIAPPPVDFARYEVVAVFRQGVGIDLTIDGVETRADRIVAHVTVREAGPHCLILLEVVHASAFALLRRTDLPVEFDERRRVVDCPR